MNDETLNDKILRFIAAEVGGGRNNHGGFLQAFANAVLRADPENYSLLRPTWIVLIVKYGLYQEMLPWLRQDGMVNNGGSHVPPDVSKQSATENTASACIPTQGGGAFVPSVPRPPAPKLAAPPTAPPSAKAEAEAREWLIAYINSQRVEGDSNLRWEDIDEDALLYGIPTPELLAAYASKITADRDEARAQRQWLIKECGRIGVGVPITKAYQLVNIRANAAESQLAALRQQHAALETEREALREKIQMVQSYAKSFRHEKDVFKEANSKTAEQLEAAESQLSTLRPQVEKLQETLRRMWENKSYAEDSSTLHHLWGIAQRLAAALKEPPVTAPRPKGEPQ